MQDIYKLSYIDYPVSCNPDPLTAIELFLSFFWTFLPGISFDFELERTGLP